MKFKSLIITCCALLMGTATFSQVQISAELRPRTEYNHGYKSLASDDQNPAFLTTQRTRLNLDYKNEVFMMKVVFQDVRLWGSESQLTTNGNNVSYIHQGWAEWFMSTNWSLKAGRQEVAYDDHRIFGSVDWAQQARAHDMAILKYTGDISAHLGIAYHNTSKDDNIYTEPDAYKALQFLWLNRKTDSYSGSFLFLNNGKPYWKDAAETEQGIRYSQTVGGHLKTNIESFTLAGNLYFQFGKDAGGKDLSAMNFSIDAMYKASETANIGAGYELLSGTEDYQNADKNKSFTPFYGTNHKFNGFMDYFYVGNHANSVGLHDVYLKGNIKPGKIKFNAALHFFSAHKNINADVNKSLGTELDFWCGYNHKGMVNLDFGYSHLFASEGMEALKGGDKGATHNWAWVMLTFKPVLYKK